jgi:hypothetical protein
VNKDINVKPKTLQMPEENTGKIHQHIGLGKYFLSMTRITQVTKAKIHK